MGCEIDGYMGLNPAWKGSLEAWMEAMADDEDDEAGGGGGGGGGGTGVDELPPPRLVSEAISLLASFRTSDKVAFSPPLGCELAVF